MHTALVIGATGLVGRALVEQLLADERFSEVRIFVRRDPGLQHPKLRVSIVDFESPGAWATEVRGDVLFSALGTTLKQAGSKEAQYRIDYTYQYETARTAAANGVPRYVLVSAAMASERSRIFYSRMKGELERDVEKLAFQKITFLQPGLLTGPRREERTGEKIGFALLRFLNRLGIARKQRPIPGSTVARAMIAAAFREGARVQTFALLDVFRLAGEAA